MQNTLVEWLFPTPQQKDADVQENYFCAQPASLSLEEQIQNLRIENEHLCSIIEALKNTNAELKASNTKMEKVQKENEALQRKLNELVEYVSILIKINPDELRQSNEQYDMVKNKLIGFLYRELRMKVAFPFSHVLGRIQSGF
jgi:predicted RNase H-like nuclease (RuvC/YqgF family)